MGKVVDLKPENIIENFKLVAVFKRKKNDKHKTGQGEPVSETDRDGRTNETGPVSPKPEGI